VSVSFLPPLGENLTLTGHRACAPRCRPCSQVRRYGETKLYGLPFGSAPVHFGPPAPITPCQLASTVASSFAVNVPLALTPLKSNAKAPVCGSIGAFGTTSLTHPTSLVTQQTRPRRSGRRSRCRWPSR
jgi:hypothetical protein